jgi:hypothetical protein
LCVVDLGFGRFRGLLLSRPNLGLLLALGCLGHIPALGRDVVGPLFRGGGALLGCLFSRALPLLGSGARVNGFLLCRVARL